MTPEIFCCKGSWLKGKKIVLALTGSVAAVKSFSLCRELIRHGADVQIVMSKSAMQMVGETLMHWASGRKVVSELTGENEHVKLLGLEGNADLLLIAPCTANVIGKIVHGIADDVVSTMAMTAIGAKKSVMLVPSMHLPMWQNPFVAENLRKLREAGVEVIEPLQFEGKAKFPSVQEIVLRVERKLLGQKLNGKKILVTAGATIEAIDPIRVLTNKSSGRMGIEIAKEAYRQGAEVTLVFRSWLKVPKCIKQIFVESFDDVKKAVINELEKGQQIFISAAAVGDFTVERSNEKLKSDKALQLRLKPSEKLIELVKKKFPRVKIVAFKAEANVPKENLLKEAKQKLEKLGLEMVVANDVGKTGIGTAEGEIYILKNRKAAAKAAGKKSELSRKIVESL